MIQRAQTVYFVIAILALLVPLAGLDLFTIGNEEVNQHITFFGNELEKDATVPNELLLPSLPFFWLNLACILLLVVTIFSFRNLKGQLRLGRFTLIIIFIVLIDFCAAAYYYGQDLVILKPATSFGLGFYMVLGSLVFVLLGNWGIKRDIKLLESLNRLR